MATRVQTNSSLFFGGYDISGVFNAISLTVGGGGQDNTVFGDGTVSNAAGLSTLTFEGEGYWSSTEDSVIEASLGIDSSGTNLTVAPVNSTKGQPAYFAPLQEAEYHPYNTGTVGEMLAFRVSGTGRGTPVSGDIYVAPGSDRTSSSTSTPPVQQGSVSATQKVYSSLHVLSASGTLTVSVKSDDSGFASPTTQITHTPFTSIGSEIKSADGPIADDYWRVDFTISGGGSFDFIVSLGIT